MIQFKVSEKDIREFAKIALELPTQQGKAMKSIRWMPYLGAILLLTTAHQAYMSGNILWTSLIGGLILCSFKFVIKNIWSPNQAAKFYQEQVKNYSPEMEYSADATTESLKYNYIYGNSEIKWTPSIQVYETKDYALVYIDSIHALVIPRTTVRGNLDAFLNTIRDKVKVA